MQISPETKPPKPLSPESCTSTLTLDGDIEDAGGMQKLLDLEPTAIQALPPRSRALLSSLPPTRTPEERGPADRRRKR
jgi:hypothetical protein